MYAEVQPMKDRQGLAHCVLTTVSWSVVRNLHHHLFPYSELPSHLFIWDKSQRHFHFRWIILMDGPKGKWWNFLQDLAKVYQNGQWIVNPIC